MNQMAAGSSSEVKLEIAHVLFDIVGYSKLSVNEQHAGIEGFPVFYRGELIGNLMPDLIVDDAVIVDPKVVACFTNTHVAQWSGI